MLKKNQGGFLTMNILTTFKVRQALRQGLPLILSLLVLLALSVFFVGISAESVSAENVTTYPGTINPITSYNVTASAVTSYTGNIDGADYLIEVPADWNGTLLLYSHGIVPPLLPIPNPATNVSNPATGAYLLSQGYALAGSSYKTTGWAIEDALVDQTALLDEFNNLVGEPSRTIAWGHSMGGMITAGLVQEFPDRFDGALPMCGLLAGGVGVQNTELDRAFAFKTLFAPATDPLQVVNIPIPNAFPNFLQAVDLLNAAQATPEGRARIALVAAFGPEPGWFDPASPEPGRRDYAAQQEAQFNWLGIAFAPEFWWRAEFEARAGGNPSWNTGVNYTSLLIRSGHYRQVRTLYREAGLSLWQDLKTLKDASRIAADPGAVEYFSENIIFDGDIQIPVLTMHTTHDGLVMVENEQAYGSVVRAAGKNHLLRQIYVHRPGHCAFTPAEEISALQALIHRLDTGKWKDSTRPHVLNEAAEALGSDLNTSDPAFVRFRPGPFLRPFDQGKHGKPNH
jgi:pimeloyl-ACP methyl ester carboxylesterase